MFCRLPRECKRFADPLDVRFDEFFKKLQKFRQIEGKLWHCKTISVSFLFRVDIWNRPPYFFTYLMQAMQIF